MTSATTSPSAIRPSMEAEVPPSPRSRLKFLCSNGGRILPRPSDGLLRYVGGETRVLSVPRPLSFKELKEKIAGMFNAELVVKYQLMTEDLDALVTVKTDEDLYHMIEEYDRLERRPRSPTATYSPCFRLFLFPYPGVAAAESSASLNQRYVDAINGGLPIPEQMHHQHPRPLFTGSFAGPSPSSTFDSLSTSNGLGFRPNAGRGNMGGAGMHRVRSTPNLGGGGSQTASPKAYQRLSPAFGYGGGSGWRIGGGGGFRQEVGYGCGCNCGCVGSSSQLNRKYVYSPSMPGGSPLGSLAEVSSPRMGSQGLHLCPPPIAGSLRRVAWE